MNARTGIILFALAALFGALMPRSQDALGEQTDSPQISEQALVVYKAISDQFDFLKKQQWATTNYLVLIYAAIAWFGRNGALSSSWVLCTLSAITVAAGLVAIGLLVWFQYDLGQLRQRADAANKALFSSHERRALDLQPYKHPYGRGWHVLAALILVCVAGAFLVVLALTLPQPAVTSTR
jgi:hypothetical protein